MAARLFRVILPVTSVEGAVVFYGRVLEMAGERVSRGRHYFESGGVILACLDPRADGEGRVAVANPEHVYFATEDLEGARERVVEAGGRMEGEIATMPWGKRMFYFVDPFGNRVAFVDEKTVFRGGAFVE